MKILKSLLILLSILTLSSCTIYEADVEGEVDMVYSSTITIRSSDFISEDDFISVADYGWDNLDEYTVDHGLVLGYIQFEGTTAWQVLPFSVPFENDLVNLRYFFDLDHFSLVLEGEVPGNNKLNADLFHRDLLRVIAIPPSQIIRGKGIDYSNFEQVRQIYNIN